MLYSHINHKRYTYTKTQADSNTQATPFFRYERFINFLTSEFGSSTRGERERHTILNHSILTKLKRSAHLIVFKISVGRDLQNSMVRLQLLNLNSRHGQSQLPTGLAPGKLPTRLAYSRVPNCRVFHTTQILSPSLPGMSFTLQPHLLFGVYYDNWDCHIHCARA